MISLWRYQVEMVHYRYLTNCPQYNGLSGSIFSSRGCPFREMPSIIHRCIIFHSVSTWNGSVMDIRDILSRSFKTHQPCIDTGTNVARGLDSEFTLVAFSFTRRSNLNFRSYSDFNCVFREVCRRYKLDHNRCLLLSGRRIS